MLVKEPWWCSNILKASVSRYRKASKNADAKKRLFYLSLEDLIVLEMLSLHSSQKSLLQKLIMYIRLEKVLIRQKKLSLLTLSLFKIVLSFLTEFFYWLEVIWIAYETWLSCNKTATVLILFALWGRNSVNRWDH